VAPLQLLLLRTPSLPALELHPCACAVARPSQQALLGAARGGDAAGFLAALAAGADPAGRDARGWAPVHHAAAAGATEILRLLITPQARQQESQQQQQKQAYCHERAQEERERGRAQEDEARAGRGGGQQQTEDQEHGQGQRRQEPTGAVPVDIPTTSSLATPLHLACKRARAPTAAFLLAAGASPHARDAHGSTPLMKACGAPLFVPPPRTAGGGGASGVEPGAAESADGEGVPAPWDSVDSASSGDAGPGGGGGRGAEADAVVAALLAAGADPCAVNDYGLAPLHFAARAGAARPAVRLLAAGADPLAETQAGRGPLGGLATSCANPSVGDACAIVAAITAAVGGSGGGGSGNAAGDGGAAAGASGSGSGGSGEAWAWRGGQGPRSGPQGGPAALRLAVAQAQLDALMGPLHTACGPLGCAAAALALRRAAMAAAAAASSAAGAGGAPPLSPEGVARGAAAARAAAAGADVLPEHVDGGLALRLLELLSGSRSRRRALEAVAAQHAAAAEELGTVTPRHAALVVGAAAALRRAREAEVAAAAGAAGGGGSVGEGNRGAVGCGGCLEPSS
jgi:ankyrin repeat protein